MPRESGFISYSYLINEKCVKSYYQEIYINIFFLVCLIGLTHAVFNSNQKVVAFLNIEFSLYYIFPLVFCIYEFSVSFYKIYFVKGKRLIKGLRVDSDIEIKLLNGKVLILDKFSLILDNNIDFKNTGSFGEKFYKKYDFNYIGIRNDEKTYLLPYKKDSKDFTIKLLGSMR